MVLALPLGCVAGFAATSAEFSIFQKMQKTRSGGRRRSYRARALLRLTVWRFVREFQVGDSRESGALHELGRVSFEGGDVCREGSARVIERADHEEWCGS